ELLSQNLGTLYPLSWLFLFSVMVGRSMVKEKGSIVRILKQYAQNVSLSLVTILIFMILAEGIIRLTRYIRENRKDLPLLLKKSQEADFNTISQIHGRRVYGLKGIVQASPYEGIVYELKPNLRGSFKDVPFFTNSKGLRDFEYSYHKKENTFRMVGLGDSSLFGWGVKMEDISLKVLERRLNQNSPFIKYEVINFSVPGYNTAIEVEVFIQKCLKYSPDLVLMNFNTNDYDVPAFMKLPQDHSNLRKSYLFDLIHSRYQILKGSRREAPIPFDFADRTISPHEADRLDEDPALPDEYRYMVGTKGYIKAMNKLGEIARTQGIPVVQFDVISHPGLPEDPMYGPNPFRAKQLELITRLSRENGFFFLNTYPYYAGASGVVAGRSVWVAAASLDEAHRRAYLETTAAMQLRQLADLVESSARPWDRRSPRLLPMLEPGDGWYRDYPG
ncbi:MAG: hypothetical protein L0Y56_15110, partial [Nitrospira sp.]|nr:hypothetical protein [Nitrospira sp.]